MDGPPNIEIVQQALNALYQNPSLNGKEKASVWLGELQKSVYGWQIADQLLQLNEDVESCYFAAQTMRTKIQYAFHELPPTSHQSLRDSLMNHVSKIDVHSPPSISTQLCLALADFTLQMASWKGSISEIILRFYEDGKYLHFLVEFLTVLPEEVGSRALRLGENRRKEIVEELIETAPVLLQLLTSCFEESSDDKLHGKVFKCLASWYDIAAIPQEHITSSKLLLAPFTVLRNTDSPNTLHDAATDCVCASLYTASLRTDEDVQSKKQYAMGLFNGALSLTDAYQAAVTAEDLDKTVNYCRIFTEMAESFLDMMVSSPNQGFGDLRILELLLTCVDHHQYEVADITFNFWYRLSERIYNVDSVQLNEIFSPYIHKLLSLLCRHCQLDTDHTGIPDDGDEFADFRVRVSEVIKDVVFIIGSPVCFSLMFSNLKAHTEDGTTWDASEAALFIMTAVAKNIHPEENEIVPQVLNAVLNMGENIHIALRYTSIHLVGELCEWIQMHPEYLENVLQYLLTGLQKTELSLISAKSLQSICNKCQMQMVNHFSGLIQIAQAMDSFSVSNDAAMGLLKGTALVLTKLPFSQIPLAVEQLCALQLKPLQSILNSPNDIKPKINSATDPSIWLDRLSSIFRSLTITYDDLESHPCHQAVGQVWPVLSSACEKYQNDVRIIERICRCIRFIVRCLGKHALTLLMPLVTQIVSLYAMQQHSCFLYLGSILVDEYGHEPTCIQGLDEMLQAFASPTFTILEQPNGLRSHPDTVDDLFRLCLRFIQKSPLQFLRNISVKPILCCAIAACSLDHKEANSSVTKFLIEFIKTGYDKNDNHNFEDKFQLVGHLLQEHGQVMVKEIINACIFGLPNYMIPDSGEILYELMKIDRASLCRWLEIVLKDLPRESTGGAINATMSQLTDFHKTVTCAEELKTVTKALRELSRLYR